MAAAAEIMVLVATGAALGVVYFGGLWLTLKRLPGSSRPWLLLLGSFLMRLALALPVLLLVVRGGNWSRLLIVTASFLMVRLVMVRRLGPRRDLQALETGGQ